MQNEYRCDCGKRLQNHDEFQRHQQNCAVAQSSKQGSSGRPMTRGAGGSQNTER